MNCEMPMFVNELLRLEKIVSRCDHFRRAERSAAAAPRRWRNVQARRDRGVRCLQWLGREYALIVSPGLECKSSAAPAFQAKTK
jgi:hypothetical protein